MKPRLLFVLAGVVAVVAIGSAQAHRLEADYRILPDGRIQVESWFETDEVPKKATVQVIGTDGKVRAEGPLDEKSGKFYFRPERTEPLRIVVTAPGGHRKELILWAAARRWWQPPPAAQRQDEGAVDIPHTARARSYTDVIAGLALLLSVPAFVLVILQRRTLAELRREVTRLRADAADRDAAAVLPPSERVQASRLHYERQ